MSNDVITTEEKIELLLKNAGQVESPLNIDDYLNAEERDVLGEIGNMCMGASVTTMNELLGRKVTITTPSISMHTPDSLGKEYPAPIVVVEVQYTEGLMGNNLLLLKEYDVALITDLLLGGEGNIDPENVVLDEIQLSAIREVMNQMVGASATSLATILNRTVNISTPRSRRLMLRDENLSELIHDKILVKISFKMDIENLLESEIMQVWPASFAKDLVKCLLNPEDETNEILHIEQVAVNGANKDDTSFGQNAPNQSEIQYSQAAELYNSAQTAKTIPRSTQNAQYAPDDYAPRSNDLLRSAAQAPRNGNSLGASPIRRAENVEAKAVRYPAFDAPGPVKQPDVQNENLGLLMEVPMQITVELGKTRKKIRDILDFNMGSVVVLDKIAGGAVDILVNGTPIARGEVVVIDENYGVRITEINTDKLKESF